MGEIDNLCGDDGESDLLFLLALIFKLQISGTYNGSDDEHANNRHEPIETSPPSRIFVSSFINRIKGLFEIADHCCSADASTSRVFFVKHWTRR